MFFCLHNCKSWLARYVTWSHTDISQPGVLNTITSEEIENSSGNFQGSHRVNLIDHALTSKGAVLTPFACGAQRAQGRQRAQGPGRVTGQQSRLPWGPWDTNLCASPPLPASSCSAGAEQKTACASRLRPCSAQTCQGTGKPQGPPQAKQVPLRAAGAAVGGDAGTRRQLP